MENINPEISKTNEFYQKILQNSVGREKRSKFKLYSQKVILKVALSVLTLTLVAYGLAGCKSYQPNIDSNNNKPTYSTEETKDDDKYNGFSILEIITYRKLRTETLLYHSDCNEYVLNGNKRSYNYKAEDFQKIEGLDETYLYGFYSLTDDSTFTEILKALGYSTLDEFLIQNKFVNRDNGKPDINMWIEFDLIQISEIMNNLTPGSGGLAR